MSEREDPNVRAWGLFLDSFDPFLYLRLAEATANEDGQTAFRKRYEGIEFDETHVAIALHAFRMMAAETFFLLLLQTHSGRNILGFMKWCQGDRFRKALTAIAEGASPSWWPQDRDLDELLENAITLGLNQTDPDGRLLIDDREELGVFVRSEADEYLRTEPFNSIKHGGRFSRTFPTLSVELKTGQWRDVVSAKYGITAYSYSETENVGALRSFSLALNPENDLERLRGLTSLMDIARGTRKARSHRKAATPIWKYRLFESEFRGALDWVTRFNVK